MVLQFDPKFLTSIAWVGFAGLLVLLYNNLVVKPKRIRSKLSNQGINGPTPTFLLGNIREIMKACQLIITTSKSRSVEVPHLHEIAPLTFPFLNTWKQKYGQMFLFSIGSNQILYVDKPKVVRDIVTCASMDFGKPIYTQRELRPLLGQGIVSSNGTTWATQRKILAPEFYMEKVKGWITIIGESANSLLNQWSSIIEAQNGTADIKVDDYLLRFSGDVISKACFGSNYSKGEEIFSKLLALQDIMSKNVFSSMIPGMRYLPTKNNREAKSLERELKNCILEVVKQREKSCHRNRDFLQMLIEATKNSDLTQDATETFIVDNCKNIYLAGSETTSLSIVWCLMLLASNQEWQDRVRAEALEICNGRIPDSHMLSKMKQLTMVIHEALRLYPPVPVIPKEALEDMELGNIHVSKGVSIWIMCLTSHTDPELWGSDAYKFNPERFANGVSGACKLPHMYMPFGFGVRICLGKDLAMTEIKMMLKSYFV
ncbi:hypothetical protein S83_058326 [Arachis hypogaea]